MMNSMIPFPPPPHPCFLIGHHPQYPFPVPVPLPPPLTVLPNCYPPEPRSCPNLTGSKIFSAGPRSSIRWKKPPPGYVKINTDASYKHDSSKAASIAGVCRDQLGNWLFGFSSRVKSDSPFEAELLAVKEALRFCWDNGLKHVIVESDSETVVDRIRDQVIGEPRNKIEAFISECQRYINQGWDCSLQHTLREGNFAADALTKIRISESPFDLHVWNRPPKSLSLILLADKMGMGVPRGGSLDQKKLQYLERLQRDFSTRNLQQRY